MNIIKWVIHRLFINTAEKNAEWLRRHSGCKIGENCHIFRDVLLGSEPYLITIGSNVTITSGCKILTHDGGIKVPMRLGLCRNADLFGSVQIGDNVFIGIDTIILPGVKIGTNTVIGAGSVVTKDIPNNSVAAGVPCKILYSIEHYYEKNRLKISQTDSLSYKEKERVLREN